MALSAIKRECTSLELYVPVCQRGCSGCRGKKMKKVAGCTGVNFQADIGLQGDVFTVTVQGFWLASRSNDFAEVANCTGPAP